MTQRIHDRCRTSWVVFGSAMSMAIRHVHDLSEEAMPLKKTPGPEVDTIFTDACSSRTTAAPKRTCQNGLSTLPGVAAQRRRT